MKKYLKIIIPIVVLFVLVFLGYKVVTKISHKKEVAKHIKTIPGFDYQTLEGKSFKNKDLKENTATVFLYFSSDCEYCQSEAAKIQENIDKFENVQLVFISFEKPKKIRAFATKYKLDSYDNVHFLSDSKASFATSFDVKSLPCLVIYDKDQKLIEKINGQTKVETLLKKLQ